MHMTGQLFECKHLGVIITILELQFTNHSLESCLELPQRNGTLPSAKILNFPKGTINLHGVHGCSSHNLPQNIR
jgi:hypothetical protein